jgi:glycine/sarcosine N-methyltransferase
MSTAQFYDGLTDTYHTLYPDWHDQTRTQADALHRLLCRWHEGPVDIVDVACGIGTQLIGLARLGHRLTGSDISVRAVQRARRECHAADVPARLLVADMRSLPLEDSCADVVVCADNALPHLLADGDVLCAFAEMRRILRPGGTAIVTTRDYDRILADPPASTRPQVFASDGQRVISFQLWTWRENSGIYDLEHFQVHESADGARTTERRTATYRAYRRAALTELALAAGLHDACWHAPRESGFFQPLMTVHRSR